MSTRDDGVKILQALGKYSDLIMTAFEENKGWLDDSEKHARAIDDMVRLRLAEFDMPDNRKPRLHANVTGLLAESLRINDLKAVNPDIGEAIEGIEFLVNQYVSSKQDGSHIDADGFLNTLSLNAVSLCDNITSQARSIWRQIDSDFGSVSLLSSKIALNKNALRKAKNLVASLDLIHLESLYKLGMRDRELRGILQVRLPMAIDNCRKDLSDALHRLNKMLFKLNQLESRARLVNDFVHHCDTRSDLAMSGYAERADIPMIFRAVKPLSVLGAVDPKNIMLEADFVEIIQGLRKEMPPEEQETVEPISAEVADNALETLVVSPFKEAIRHVFFECLARTRRMSGVDCFEQAPEGIDIDIWLYGLMAEYSAMSQADRSLFDVSFPGHNDHYFNGNYYAEDVLICPRSASTR